MRASLFLVAFLFVTACVQEEGTIQNGSFSGTTGGTTGSTSGGTTGGTSGTPTDPLYQFQWHLHNTGQDIGEDSDYPLVADVDINAEQAHATATGAGIRMVISDSGVDYTHPDLDDNTLPGEHRNYSFIDPTRWRNQAEAYPSGNIGHGTAVAGIAAAEGWNDIGIRGVAPDVSFAAFKYILTESAVDHTSSLLAKELDQLEGDFDIFNFSYGYNQCFFQGNAFYDSLDGNSTGDDDNYADAIAAEIGFLARSTGGSGSVYVQSAGNDYVKSLSLGPTYSYSCLGNTNAHAPLTIPEKVVVAAISGDGIVSSYSSPGSGIWVSGIGGEGQVGNEYIPAVFTTDIGDCSSGMSFRNNSFRVSNPFNFGFDRELNPECFYTNTMNGTSSAAPMVSGVVALMLELRPELTWRDIKHILAVSAKKPDYFPGDATWVSENDLSHPLGRDFGSWGYDEKWIFNGLSGFYENDAGFAYSNWYGFGLVDASAALVQTLSHVLLSAEQTESEASAVLNLPIDNTYVYGNDPTANILMDSLTELGSVTIESVQVKITTNHTLPGDLGINLVGPNGTHKSRLILVDSGIRNLFGDTEYTFLTNAFYGEDSAGTWTIEILDGNSTNRTLPDSSVDSGSGDLVSWEIIFRGR